MILSIAPSGPFSTYALVSHAAVVSDKYRLPALVCQVDGLLLLHLINKDWSCLGITSQLTARRIEVAMQPYRLRFEHKQVWNASCTPNSTKSARLINPQTK